MSFHANFSDTERYGKAPRHLWAGRFSCERGGPVSLILQHPISVLYCIHQFPTGYLLCLPGRQSSYSSKTNHSFPK